MDTVVLKALAGVVSLLVSGCSLVVDTSECDTDSDCSFGDGTPLQCVSNECVEVTESTVQQLVPSEVRADLFLDGSGIWVFGGVSVIAPHTRVVVGEVDVEVLPGAAIELREASELVCTSPCPELREIVVQSSASESL